MYILNYTLCTLHELVFFCCSVLHGVHLNVFCLLMSPGLPLLRSLTDSLYKFVYLSVVVIDRSFIRSL